MSASVLDLPSLRLRDVLRVRAGQLSPRPSAITAGFLGSSWGLSSTSPESISTVRFVRSFTSRRSLAWPLWHHYSCCIAMPWQQFFIQIALVALMAYGTKRAFDLRAGDEKGAGVRFIQVLSIVLIPPMILVLAVGGLLTGQGVGTALGVLMGYALSGILKPVPSRSQQTKQN